MVVALESFGAKRAAIIYNPTARGLLGRLHLLQRASEALPKQGIEAHLVATTAPGSASLQVKRSIDAGCDLIIAAGGDGTINEVANGMLGSGVPLAIFPGGTANVLAHEIGLPINLERAATRLADLHPCRIAIGVLRAGEGLHPRYFLCMAGAGLDAEIVSRINLDFKLAMGKFAYYLGGFAQVFRPLREFEVTVDGIPYQSSFALISRVRNYGGDLEIARGASLLRNDFEVVLFRGTLSARYLQYLLGVTLRRAHRMKGCTVLRGSSITCSSPDTNATAAEIYVQLDGELAGKLPITAEIIPDALTLLVPPEYLAREQSYVAVPVYA